jgi:bacterial/archaeal transporter family-2 protein
MSPSQISVSLSAAMLGNLALILIAGAATAAQPGMNAQFAKFAGHRVHGGLVNFAVGLLVMLVVWAIAARALNAPTPSPAKLATGPWWMWFGGVLGAYFVTTAVFLTPKVGAASYLSAMIVGQLIASLIIDHWGLLGLPQVSVTPTRIFGGMLILAGMACIKWS